MLAKKYKSVVKSISNPFQGIYTLEFASLGRPYKYLPGQFLHLAIDSEYDGAGQWPESRCFSMQSNPDEETIRITYSVKGDFTRQMELLLKEGSEVWLKLPYGDLFEQHHDKNKTVFIAGGTGVTPFLSLFTHASFSEYLHPHIYLGFRSEAYNIYQDELNNSCNSSKFLQFIYENEVGIIDINRIFAENGTTASYFISGPPAMIKSFKSLLRANGVNENNVLTDDWE